MNGRSYTVDVQEDENGEAFIQLPDEMIAAVKWKDGDVINWTDNKDGTYMLTKKETEWVMVECVSTFRIRYMVEVPIGNAIWSLDTVTMNEAKEFSQEHLGEQIVSHRVVSKEEAIQICDQDNEYTMDWPEDKKVEVFFTPWEEQKHE